MTFQGKDLLQGKGAKDLEPLCFVEPTRNLGSISAFILFIPVSKVKDSWLRMFLSISFHL